MTTLVRRALVANRGEIARRVFATCRRLGISTVAVYSDADAQLPFVGEADVAVRLPGNSPQETYLQGDALIQAALLARADAIHPGYGFLSESASFARAVVEAGLIWIGPAPESIEAMGDKLRAKGLMRQAGVPVLEAPTDTTAADLPLLVKASAGGGGRGMRVVRELVDLEAAIQSASAEAESAFGDGTVFVEPYIEPGRHVEVQVVGHRDGVLVLGERDCSIQRRHQKVVEETPAPNLPDKTRAALHEAARAAAAAIDYRGAGTVEFLYDAAGDRFFFLEMNTRLQVEHPVTELVHGVDLVELQIAVAEDRPLDPRAIGETYGHAIEVRLYAEDPTSEWQPQSGRLTTLDFPGVDTEFDLLNRPGLRLDSGFEAGNEVSTYYDAMLAKLIVWAPTRDQAIRRMIDALSKARIHGLTTNRQQLTEILDSVDFAAGDVSTSLLLDLPSVGPRSHVLAAFAATAIRVAELAASQGVQRGVTAGWRNVRAGKAAWHTMTWQSDVVDYDVEWVAAKPVTGFPNADIDVLAIEGDAVRLRFEQEHETWRITLSDGGTIADADGPTGHVRLALKPRFTDPADAIASGSLLAPMPGTVVKVTVEAGALVDAGAVVVVLEAMKMQHNVTAPTAGAVTAINVQAGDQVAAGDVLAVVEEQE